MCVDGIIQNKKLLYGDIIMDKRADILAPSLIKGVDRFSWT